MTRFSVHATAVVAIVLALVAGRTSIAGENRPATDATFESIRSRFVAAHVKPDHIKVRQVADLPQVFAAQVTAEEVALEFKGGQTETFFIVRPKGHRGTLQPIVYGPHADCFLSRQANAAAIPMLLMPPAGAVFRFNRALVIPIWEGSFERFSGAPRDGEQQMWRQWMLAWHQTLSVVLDHLQTLPDMDAGRVGFLGYSFGSAYIAPGALALEGRIKAAVLVSGGLDHTGESWPGMLDHALYLPRVRIPVLMINGRYDSFFPHEPAQKAMFNLLGTPAAQKQHILVDSGHAQLPWESLATRIRDWFDKHLGPVR